MPSILGIPLKFSFTLFLYSGLALAMFVLFASQMLLAPDATYAGEKGNIIDLWCVAHFLYGIILAGSWQKITREALTGSATTSRWLLLTVASICVWEMIEFPMEIGAFGLGAKEWMGGVEPWENRYLLDPGLALVGVAAYRNRPQTYLPSLALGLTWEIANLASPTAMSIQKWLITFVRSVF